MMATLVDPQSEDNRNDLIQDDVEASEAEEVQAERVEAEVEESGDDLPDKYRGKSVAELAEMHSNLERLMGKQSQEVGELRKAFDEMVQKTATAQQTTTPEPEIDDVDFYTDPKGTFEKLLANHPTLKNAEAMSREMRKREALAALQSAHPDMNDIVKDEGFKEWVGKSKIRSELFRDADVNYNYEAANELFDLWKDRQAVVKQTAKVEKVAQKNEVKKAATGSARSNPDGQKSRKVYRRRDIIELMNKDPKRYEALQPEIMKAYSEGRVR